MHFVFILVCEYRVGLTRLGALIFTIQKKKINLVWCADAEIFAKHITVRTTHTHTHILYINVCIYLLCLPGEMRRTQII